MKLINYPGNFNTKGLPLDQRKGKGRPVVIIKDREEYYVTIYGSIQFHGEEGMRDGISSRVKGGKATVELVIEEFEKIEGTKEEGTRDKGKGKAPVITPTT